MDVQLTLKALKLDRRTVEALEGSLELEVKHLPSKRYRGTIEATGETLSVHLETNDLQALRAVINSYIRYISVGYYAIKVLNTGT
ncbi:MAG: KEOPS complex subunit Pcc1 [Candidatus Bathyarchaeia archaeon]